MERKRLNDLNGWETLKVLGARTSLAALVALTGAYQPQTKIEAANKCQRQDCLVEYLQTDPRWASYVTQYHCDEDNKDKQCTFGKISCGYTAVAILMATYVNPGIYPLDMLREIDDAGGDGLLSYQQVVPFLENNGFTVTQARCGDAKYTEKVNEKGVLGLITATLMDVRRQPEHWTIITGTDSKGNWQLQDPRYGKLDCRRGPHGPRDLICTDTRGKKHNMQVNMRWTVGIPKPQKSIPSPSPWVPLFPSLYNSLDTVGYLRPLSW